MSYKDLRDFIRILEENNELLKIKAEIDWKYEVGGWIRKSCDMKPCGPALFFENIKGYSSDYRIASGLIGSYRRFALALGLPVNTPPLEIIRTFKNRVSRPIEPKMVNDGPCKENIYLDNKINLFQFPAPWFHPRDGGRFIGTWHGVVSKDINSGIRNIGTHRLQIIDRSHTTIGMLATAHIKHHLSQRQKINKPLEVAVVIGGDETLVMASGTSFPADVDEFTLAGALREEPLELVKCETVDLEVPANSEIVIEGLILPNESHLEGPFGEWAGYHAGGVRLRPVLKVTAITHRNKPILRSCLLGKPVTEDQYLYSIGIAAEALRIFETHGPEGVLAVNCPPEGVGSASAIVQMSPRFVGHSWNVGRTLISSRLGHFKTVVLVDEDIDPFDLGEVWWSINTRVQGSRDIEVLRFCPQPRTDPSNPPGNGEFGDRIIIDATKKLDYPFNPLWDSHWPPVAYPPKEIMTLVEQQWKHIVEGNEQDLKAEEEYRNYINEDFEKSWHEWRQKSIRLFNEKNK